MQPQERPRLPVPAGKALPVHPQANHHHPYAIQSPSQTHSVSCFAFLHHWVSLNSGYDEIQHVEFARVSKAKKEFVHYHLDLDVEIRASHSVVLPTCSSKATFDLVVTLKSDEPQLTFTGISR
jgi:hypothetical protein